MTGLPKTEAQTVLPSGVSGIHRSAICAQPRTERCQKTSNLLERLSMSKFPYRHPVLYGLLFELRSFGHRIQSLRKRGDIRPLEIGFVYQPLDAHGCLVRNKLTQARSTGIQQLLAEYPWLSAEDCYLFLVGWNAGREWHESLGTAENSDDRQGWNCSSVLREPGTAESAQ